MNLHPATFAVLAFVSLSFFNERSYGLSAKFIPEFKRAETNYKWFKIDKRSVKPDERLEEMPVPIMYNSKFQDFQQHNPQGGMMMENENIPLPLALSMLQHEKRGMFDLGTGRGYSGYQAMRGNLGLAFASPGSHGKK